MLDSFLEVEIERTFRKQATIELTELLNELPVEEVQKLASGVPTEELYSYLDRKTPGEKTALMECGPDGGTNGIHTFLDAFKGTALFEQAIALEQEELQAEMLDQQKRQERRAMNQGDDQMWDAKDKVRLRKRLLELELAKQQNGTSTVAPVPGAETQGSGTMGPVPAEGVQDSSSGLVGSATKMGSVKDKALHVVGTGLGHGAQAIGGAVDQVTGPFKHIGQGHVGYGLGGLAATGGLMERAHAVGKHQGREDKKHAEAAEKVAFADKSRELTGNEGAAAMGLTGLVGLAGARKAKANGYSAAEGAVRGNAGATLGTLGGGALGHALGGKSAKGKLIGMGLGAVGGGVAGYKALTHAVSKEKRAEAEQKVAFADKTGRMLAHSGFTKTALEMAELGAGLSKAVQWAGKRENRALAGGIAGAGVGALAGGPDNRLGGALAGGALGAGAGHVAAGGGGQLGAEIRSGLGAKAAPGASAAHAVGPGVLHAPGTPELAASLAAPNLTPKPGIVDRARNVLKPSATPAAPASGSLMNPAPAGPISARPSPGQLAPASKASPGSALGKLEQQHGPSSVGEHDYVGQMQAGGLIPKPGGPASVAPAAQAVSRTPTMNGGAPNAAAMRPASRTIAPTMGAVAPTPARAPGQLTPAAASGIRPAGSTGAPPSASNPTMAAGPPQMSARDPNATGIVASPAPLSAAGSKRPINPTLMGAQEQIGQYNRLPSDAQARVEGTPLVARPAITPAAAPASAARGYVHGQVGGMQPHMAAQWLAASAPRGQGFMGALDKYTPPGRVISQTAGTAGAPMSLAG